MTDVDRWAKGLFRAASLVLSRSEFSPTQKVNALRVILDHAKASLEISGVRTVPLVLMDARDCPQLAWWTQINNSVIALVVTLTPDTDQCTWAAGRWCEPGDQLGVEVRGKGSISDIPHGELTEYTVITWS